MKYFHSKIESAEYLRLALPLMSKQDAPLHPISYAVWYEYVAGINKDLNTAVDTLTKRGIPLTEEEIETLFNEHVADITSEAASSISQEFQRIIGEIAVSTSEVAKEAGHFGQTLLDIEKNSALSGAKIDIKTLITSTQAMQSLTNALKDKLAESQCEIEGLREELTRAREASLRDALTGLTNRRGFDQALDACLASLCTEDDQDPAAQPCLLMCDIDHFKKINDTYGHLFGDKVIRAVARVLTDNIKGRDIAARYGGEEFIVLLPATPLEGARSLAEKLRSTIETGRIKRGNTEEMAKVTISLGVSRYLPGETSASFIERADKALYAAKQNGRNQVVLAQA
jgi:diguanylate cyclase